MSVLIMPKTDDWIDRAARDAAHQLNPKCSGGRGYGCGGDGPRYHSAGCDRAKDVITNHMRAAVALARKYEAE